MATTIVMTSATLTPLLAVDNEPAKRLDEAAAVFSEIMGSPDKGIPQVARGGMSRPAGSVTEES